MSSDWTCFCFCHNSQKNGYCRDCEMHHSNEREKLESRIAELERVKCPNPAVHSKTKGLIFDAIIGIIIACALAIGGLIHAIGGFDSKLDKQSASREVTSNIEVSDPMRVTVDYSQPLEEMIAAGRYGRVNSNITEENFPIKGSGKVDLNLELVCFNKYISSNEAIAELKKLGMRPATLPELLAFDEKYLEEQRKYPILALGSVWRDWDGRNAPCLWDGSDGRRLRLYWIEVVWGGDCRFLVVREP